LITGSPDRNCGRFSKYLTSKIGDSKHDDDEKMQHKKLVPVHNMLRGYTFSGASAGDAISIMGTSAGDDNDMVGTSSDDERLIFFMIQIVTLILNMRQFLNNAFSITSDQIRFQCYFINIKGKQLYTIAIRILDPLVKNHIDRLLMLKLQLQVFIIKGRNI
jgi:hypothetical protein